MDGLSPNIVLENVIRAWNQQVEILKLENIKLGSKCKNLKINRLAVADDLEILSLNIKIAEI